MRYFSRGWANGELADDECDAIVAAYELRLATIEPRLPPAMRQLARLDLHDAVLERVCWSPLRRELRVAFVTRVPAPQCVTATYQGAMLGDARIDALRRAARDRDTAVLYDEVDLDEVDGSFAHRLLFWPREEVTIEFRALQLEVAARADDRVQLGGAFVEEPPPDAPATATS